MSFGLRRGRSKSRGGAAGIMGFKFLAALGPRLTANKVAVHLSHGEELGLLAARGGQDNPSHRWAHRWEGPMETAMINNHRETGGKRAPHPAISSFVRCVQSYNEAASQDTDRSVMWRASPADARLATPQLS